MSMVEERGLVECSSSERSSITEEISVLSGQEMEMATLLWEVAEQDEDDWVGYWGRGGLILPWVRQKAAISGPFWSWSPSLTPVWCLSALVCLPLSEGSWRSMSSRARSEAWSPSFCSSWRKSTNSNRVSFCPSAENFPNSSSTSIRLVNAL